MSKTLYLQRLGQSWYVRIKVPASIRSRVGTTHIRRALGTRDLDEANRRKWSAVAEIQRQFDRVSGHHLALLTGVPVPPVEDAPMSLPARLVAPVEISSKSLDVLIDAWLDGSDYIAQTRQQHKHAYLGLRAFLGGDRLPSSVTPEVAVEFVEEDLKRTSRSYATKRRKLNSLIAFWDWLGLRGCVKRGQNPWRGFRLGSKRTRETPTDPKRPFTDTELVTLFSERPSYPGLADVMVLGLYTGMRLEEICSLRSGDVRHDDDGVFYLHIGKSKTRAGIRTIAVSHANATRILTRRTASLRDKADQLFPEFKGGGYDDKLSWAVSKAFGRFRDRIGLERVTDFHSMRRSFITLMENLAVDQVRIARYVGHELPTIAFVVYSGGSSKQTMRDVAGQVRYAATVESQVERFAERGG